MITFSKYKKIDGKTRVQLLYLILNNYDLSKVEIVVETVEKKKFGAEFRKIFGVTNEFVDIRSIEDDLLIFIQQQKLYALIELIFLSSLYT